MPGVRSAGEGVDAGDEVMWEGQRGNARANCWHCLGVPLRLSVCSSSPAKGWRGMSLLTSCCLGKAVHWFSVTNMAFTCWRQHHDALSDLRYGPQGWDCRLVIMQNLPAKCGRAFGSRLDASSAFM